MTSIHGQSTQLRTEEKIRRLRRDLGATATLSRRLGIDPDEALRTFAALLRGQPGNPEENRP